MNAAPVQNRIDDSKPPLSRRILLIDDRRDNILVMQRLLELDGHEVFLATAGRDGVTLARQLTPDVILCDIGLPGGMNGYDVATEIRADPVCHAVYLVAVSGYGDEEHRRKAREAGFDYYMTKPVMKDKLDELTARMPRFTSDERKHPGWPGAR